MNFGPDPALSVALVRLEQAERREKYQRDRADDLARQLNKMRQELADVRRALTHCQQAGQ